LLLRFYRYKITIEYIGTGFVGWQRQKEALSIQQVIEEAIYKFSKEQASVIAAGRTDTGVHATGQVAHFDLPCFYENYELIRSINHFLREYSVGVVDCCLVDSDFSARFSARARHYLYRIINRLGRVVIESDRAWWVKHELDIQAMREGAAYLIGTHDFTSFRGKHCQAKSAIKTLSKLEIIKNGEEINFYLSAPSFLHNMVRNIVGSLVQVGIGKWTAKDIKAALDSKNREAAGVKAPSCGLYLTKVDY
jgi:tRNA pseudouridine38-40 synthase